MERKYLGPSFYFPACELWNAYFCILSFCKSNRFPVVAGNEKLTSSHSERSRRVLQLTSGCVTHGRGSAPQYTQPDSGTRAGSRRWLRTSPHSSNSSHRSAARRRAQRSRPGSGRLVYLSRGRVGGWGEGGQRRPVLLRWSLLSLTSNWFDSPRTPWDACW